jgi:hypothetical protein
MAALRILTLVCGTMTVPGIITLVFVEEMNPRWCRTILRIITLVFRIMAVLRIVTLVFVGEMNTRWCRKGHGGTREGIHQEQVAEAPVHQPVTTGCGNEAGFAPSKVERLTPGHAVEDVPILESEQRQWRGQPDLPSNGAPLGAHGREADAVDVSVKAPGNETSRPASSGGMFDHEFCFLAIG